MDIDPVDPAATHHTRRELIKRSAVAGAAIWAAPAILSVSRASAASPPPPGCTTCAASAYGIQISGTVAGLPVSLPPVPTTGALNGGLICATPVLAAVLNAGLACVEASDANGICEASATIQSVAILGTVVTTGVIQSDASSACDCSGGSLTSSVASITVLGTPVVGITGAPNHVLTTITVGGTSVTITENQQTCTGTTSSVDALVIHIVVTVPLLGTVTDITVTIAHSQVDNGCPCV